MSTDPHEIRMAVGQAAASMLDAYDDETLELMEPVCHSVSALAEHLQTFDLPRLVILQILLGVCTGAAFHGGI